MKKEFITTDEASELLGISRSGVYLAMTRKNMDAYKRGRDWFLNKADVIKYRDSRRKLNKEND